MKIQFEHLTHPYLLDLTVSGQTATAACNGETAAIEILRAENGRLDLRVNGQLISAHVSSEGLRRWVTIQGRTFLLTRADGLAPRARPATHGASELTAPMPGLVRAVQVQVGESVSQGQTLLIVEAMKMELKVCAPRAGTVKSLKIQPGATVERDQILAEIE